MLSSTTISVVLLLASRATAQTTNDPLNSFLSGALSVYTEVTSILASDASNTATSTSSSSVATTTSSSSLTSSTTSPSPTSTKPSVVAATAAAASTSTATHHTGGLSSTNLAIILGCVLGALVIGLLILVLLLCCRRRRHSRSGAARTPSPNNEEIASWRGLRGNKNRPGSRDGLIAGHSHHNSGPDMAEHPAYANHNHENPFVPVPPAPRRSAQNSRAGLTDGMVPGQEPYITGSNGTHKDHHHGGELAAGAGGAALGAAALHHHEKNKESNDDTLRDSYDEKPGFVRRPVPDNTYPTTTTNDDAYALNKVPSRKSGEAPRYNADDYNYSTGPNETGQRGLRQPNTSAPLSPFNAAGHHRNSSGENGHPLLAAGAGALGGAAIANHHNRDRSNSGPRRSYYTAITSDRNPPPMPQPMPLQDTSAARDLVSPISSDSYSSGTGTTHHLSGSTATNNAHHIPSEMPADEPVAQPISPVSARPRSHSGSAPAAAALAHRRSATPPHLPSRSPKRTRFSDPHGPEPAATSSHDSSSNSNSDNSTWRLSSGMPGSWSRRDSSPAANSAHLRNAGINPMGRNTRAESPMRHSLPAGRSGSGKRLRLADLQREEEERLMQGRRGRQSMGSEWSGNEAYDGYEHGHHGVGQAM